MKKTKTASPKKKGPDRIEVLVKEYLANTAAAEDTFRIALALLEKHKAKYAELEQYVENVSPSDRTISVLDNVEGSKRAHHIFKIVVTGVEVAYQVTPRGKGSFQRR
jgi:P2-related tail formation protein